MNRKDIYLWLSVLMLFNLSCKSENQIYDKSISPKYYLEKFLNSPLNNDFNTFLRYGLPAQEKRKTPNSSETAESMFREWQGDRYKIKSITQLSDVYLYSYKEISVEAVRFKVALLWIKTNEEVEVTYNMIKINDSIKNAFEWIISEIGDWVVEDW